MSLAKLIASCKVAMQSSFYVRQLSETDYLFCPLRLTCQHFWLLMTALTLLQEHHYTMKMNSSCNKTTWKAALWQDVKYTLGIYHLLPGGGGAVCLWWPVTNFFWFPPLHT